MDHDESSQVVFENEESPRPAQSTRPQSSKILQWIIAYSGGFIKDEKHAQYVVIAFVLLACGASLLLLLSTGSSSAQQDMTRAMIDKAIQATDAPR